MDLSEVTVLALAAWRLSVLLVHERGPWDSALLIRRVVGGIVHDADGEPVGIPDTMLGGLFGCVWCMSVWVAAAFVWVHTWQWAGVLIYPLAVAGGALLLDLLLESVARRSRNG